MHNTGGYWHLSPKDSRLHFRCKMFSPQHIIMLFPGQVILFLFPLRDTGERATIFGSNSLFSLHADHLNPVRVFLVIGSLHSLTMIGPSSYLVTWYYLLENVGLGFLHSWKPHIHWLSLRVHHFYEQLISSSPLRFPVLQGASLKGWVGPDALV